jgi:hypothetical protein
MMDTTYPSAADAARPNALQRLRLPEWAREPLLHFFLLGVLLFAVDHYMVAREGDPRVIVVGPEVDAEARQIFVATRGREPTAAELEALRQRWLDNEVLYREGLAMKVDLGDDAIRERVIFKALSVVDANLQRPAVDDAKLRQWFEDNRARYDEPARFDFQEAVLSTEPTESAVRSFVSRLNDGVPGDVDAGLRVFRGRPHASIVESYGPDLAAELEAATGGEWIAVRSKDGWKAMRLESSTPSRPADYEQLRGVVLQDWNDETMAQLRTDAVRALAAKYEIRTPAIAP